MRANKFVCGEAGVGLPFLRQQVELGRKVHFHLELTSFPLAVACLALPLGE